MHLTDLLRTSAFRTAVMACAGFGAVTLLLFGFIYWQTAGLETRRLDGFVMHEYAALSHESAASMLADVNTRYSYGLHRLAFAAIFSPTGILIAGDLATLPPGLPADGRVHDVEVLRHGDTGPERERARAMAGRLADQRVLVMGRSEQDVAKLRALVLRAMGLGLVPALAAALGIGLLASRRTIVRVREMNLSINRIMQGHLHERLPSAGTSDALDQLAISCNRMLADIEHLLGEVKGVGDSIAHDLRTPLARLRMRMETGRVRAATSQADLDAVLARSIEDLDQCLGIITALLRIGELEAGRRQAGFAQVSLGAILHEAAELYAPLAEERGLEFQFTIRPDMEVLEHHPTKRGHPSDKDARQNKELEHDPIRLSDSTRSDHALADRELLLEAVVNLLDNAIKFAPAGGSVAIALRQEEAGPVIRVSDSGQGIALQERDAVLERFYRAAPGRHIAGNGLGLSLVSAILRLHGFDLRMSTGQDGFSVDIVCRRKEALLF